MRFTSQTGQHHHETLGQFSPDPAPPYKSGGSVLSGVVLQSPEALAMMGPIAGGVVMASLVISVIFTRVVGNRIRGQARRAMEQKDPALEESVLVGHGAVDRTGSV